jgi:hypothetical protein
MGLKTFFADAVPGASQLLAGPSGVWSRGVTLLTARCQRTVLVFFR